GTTHEFWKAVHAGAEKAGKELGVEIIWKGPLKEDDLKQQIDLVQAFTAQRVSGIVLAPLNDKALAKVVKDASRAKVPVVVIDSALAGEEHVSFVATDNKAAGKLAAQRMKELLPDGGKVVVLRYQEGSASTEHREEGFLEGIQADGIEVVSANQYAGATTESAFAASESLLLAQKAGEAGVNGVFCPNESTTFGMLLALRKLGLAGKIHLVGFDASEKMIAGLKEGHIDALVLQDPFTMGEKGVRTVVAHLKGEKLDPVVDTGSTIVDAKNMDTPEIQRLLRPDLDKWLGGG
ncbi:MAG: substrate-binding domain-containing protein, partial [Acidimicrobiales bacterium]|nr:substrate-binding domain-containing protein [Acidimicrobiales bacterium]